MTDAQRIAELEAEVAHWKLALEDLTPGGSEFQTPGACVAWVLDARSRQHGTITRLTLEKKAAEARVAELEDGLRGIVDAAGGARDTGWESYSDGYGSALIDQANRARALLNKDNTNG